MSNVDYYLLFSLTPEIGPKRFAGIVSEFEDVEEAWDRLGTDKNLKINNVRLGEVTIELIHDFKKKFSLEHYKERLHKARVTFIAQNSEEYPQELLRLSNPPIGLYVKGNSSLFKTKKFGVVGTRKVTSYGKEVTNFLTSQLASYNYTTVSGLALGIDAIAHRATLDAKGATIAVLGCGVDCCNPRENERLYNEIIESGSMVISEYPLGTAPTKGSFPARNRIIAALSKGVLVPEAGADSGSLITAKYAKDLGIPIFAVPGPITSRQSDGTSFLLREGAHLVQSAQDIMKILGGSLVANATKLDIEMLPVTEDEKTLLRLIQDEEKSFDRLIRESNFATSILGMMLGNLELSGYIAQKSNGLYSLKKSESHSRSGIE